MSRVGKIARLPYQIRELLSRRLDNNEEGEELLDWLNSLPEVKGVVDAQFGGVPTSKQNLSEWRQGGYREWSIHQELQEKVHGLSENARELEDTVDPPFMAGDLTTVLAARFAGILTTRDGEPCEKVESVLRMLRILVRDIALLQRTMHRATGQRNEFNKQVEDERKRELAQEKEKALAPLMAVLEARNSAEAYGGGEAGRKIAEFVIAVRRDLPLPNIVKQPEPDAGQNSHVKPGQT